MSFEKTGYEDLMEYAEEFAMDGTDRGAMLAQAVATMAVAERLDRLCEVMSRRGRA